VESKKLPKTNKALLSSHKPITRYTERWHGNYYPKFGIGIFCYLLAIALFLENFSANLLAFLLMLAAGTFFSIYYGQIVFFPLVVEFYDDHIEITNRGRDRMSIAVPYTQVQSWETTRTGNMGWYGRGFLFLNFSLKDSDIKYTMSLSIVGQIYRTAKKLLAAKVGEPKNSVDSSDSTAKTKS
jgi:hypothetical protein